MKIPPPTLCPRRTRTRRIAGAGVLLASLLATVPARADDPRFTIDPITDGVLTGGGFGFSLLLNLILATGELRPGLPGDPDKLLSIDRVAVTQTLDPHAGPRSDWAVRSMFLYVLLDPILSGVRDGRRALLVDAVLYSEAMAITLSFNGATKIAVRRPRPIAYVRCSPQAAPDNADFCSDADLQLSFFSQHAATAATLTATATYLAFTRSGPRAWQPWVTLGVGTALTAFISYERVRAGKHFPTDVLMGSIAGGAIGVLVPHLHRRARPDAPAPTVPPVVVGFAPLPGSGGALTVSTRF